MVTNSEAADDQAIPRSLAITLRVLRARSPEYQSMPKFARLLAKAPGRFAFDGISKQQISLIERAQQLSYWHLARYANSSGIPAGVLLFVSRISSHLRDRRNHEARQLVMALRDFCDAILTNFDELSGSREKMASGDPEFLDAYRASHREQEAPEELAKREHCAILAHALLALYPETAKGIVRELARDLPPHSA